MTMQKGADLKLEIEDPNNEGQYLAVGGFRSNSVRFEGTTIDGGHKGTGNYKTAISGSGETQMIVIAAGLLQHNAATDYIRDLAINRRLSLWRVRIGHNGSYEGYFSVTQFSFDGDVDGLLEYDLQIESSGEFRAI